MMNWHKRLRILALVTASSVFLPVLGAPPQKKTTVTGTYAEPPHAISVDVRPQLFATLCALDAAGFESNVSASNLSPGRAQLKQRMLGLQGPAVDALRHYYSEHA